MQKGQTSVRNGIQDLLCPFPVMYITQGANEGSHKGLEAIDVRGKNRGVKEPYYAPCDLKVVQIYSSSNTVLWQSKEPVRLANGKVDYITIATAHDDTVNFKVGFETKQGLQIGNMGIKGIGTGVHCHIEVGYGRQNDFPKNGQRFTLGGKTYDIYGLKQQIPFEDAFFMDGTEVISGRANWKFLKDVEVGTYNLAPTGSFEFERNNVRVRNGKDGLNGKDTGLRYNAGQKLNRYDSVYEKDGYVWLSYISASGVRRSVAVGQNGELWGKNF